MSVFKKSIPLLLFLLSWFAIIAEFVLMIQNRIVSSGETIIRFFSYFTILTNIIVAFVFTTLMKRDSKVKDFFYRVDTMTGVTVYILIVGLIYNLVLRYSSEPKGFQIIVDELLHTIIPLLCFNFWWEYVGKHRLRYQSSVKWLIYPFIFLTYTLIYGKYSGFYPYPFLNANDIGYRQFFINSAILTGCFLIVSWILITISRVRSSKLRNNANSYSNTNR